MRGTADGDRMVSSMLRVTSRFGGDIGGSEGKGGKEERIVRLSRS